MGFQRVCAPFGGVFRGNAPKSLSAESEKPAWHRSAALEALRKGEFRNRVAKEGRPAREGVLNSNEVAAIL